MALSPDDDEANDDDDQGDRQASNHDDARPTATRGRRGTAFHSAVDQEVRERWFGEGHREQVALGAFAAEGPELVELLSPLDTFCDDAELEGASQGEHGAHDGGVFGVAPQPGDEGVVDLENVDREAAEMGER